MKIDNFIKTLRESDKFIELIFMNGGCYQFHLILKKMFPESLPAINENKNHVATLYKGKYYDIKGESKEQFFIMKNKEHKMCEKWSFANNNSIYVKECEVCGEPIRINP